MIAIITADSTGMNADNIRKELKRNLNWSAFLKSFASCWGAYEIGMGINMRVTEFNHAELNENSVVICAEKPTKLAQRVLKWIVEEQNHSNGYHEIGGQGVHTGNFRLCSRYSIYTEEKPDPYFPEKNITAIYFNGGIGVKKHPLSIVARGYKAIGSARSDGSYVHAFTASQYFSPEKADEFGVKKSIYS